MKKKKNQKIRAQQTKMGNNSAQRGSWIIPTMNEHGIIGDKQVKMVSFYAIASEKRALVLDTRRPPTNANK